MLRRVTRLRISSAHRRAALQTLAGILLTLPLASGLLCSPFSSPASGTLSGIPPSPAKPGTGFQSHFRDIRRSQLPPFLLADDLKPGLPGVEDEDPDGRADWFMFQRTYGSDSIPIDARSRAWKSQTAFQTSSRFQTQASAAWRSIGPSPTASAWPNAWGATSGRVNSIAVSPRDTQIVLLGTSTGGIWRSTDRGASFAPVSDDQSDLEVGYLAFSKSAPSIAYAGMGDTKLGYLGSGVLKSTDEGVSWTRVSNNSLPAPGSIARLEIDPTNSNRVFVALYSVRSEERP